MVACCRVGVTECSSVCTGPFEGSHHYLNYPRHSLASGQTTGRKQSCPSKENWIKVLLTMELWNEVHDIVQETGIKTIHMEKKCKKGKMAVWGVLINSYEKKRSERQRIKGKIYLFECKVPKNKKER